MMNSRTSIGLLWRACHGKPYSSTLISKAPNYVTLFRSPIYFLIIPVFTCLWASFWILLSALTCRADQLEIRQHFSQPSTSTSHIGEAADNNQVGSAELLFGMCMEEDDFSLLGSHVPREVPDVYSTETDFSGFNL